MGRRGCAAAALCLGGALVACSSKPDPDPLDSAERVVLGGKEGGVVPSDDEVRANAERALAGAEAAWRSGDALTALALANRGLREGVPVEMDAAFREMRAKARGAVVASKVARITAIPEKDAVSDGSELPLRIEFQNLSTATLHIPRTEKGASDAALVLTLTREDWDVYGNVRSSDLTMRAPVTADLAIAPGASDGVRLVVPAEMAKLSHEGFSVLRLGGTFRPVVLRVGETELFDALPIEAASVRIFQRGYEALADDPLGSLAKAIEKRSPPHILTSTELLAPRDRPEAVRLLEAAATRDAELRFALEAALARLRATAAPVRATSGVPAR